MAHYLDTIGLPLDDTQKLQDLLYDSMYYGTEKLSNYLKQIITDKIEADERAIKEKESEPVVEEPIQDEEWLEQFSSMTLEQSKKAEKYFEEATRQLEEQKQDL